jgi:archaellum component FlaC
VQDVGNKVQGVEGTVQDVHGNVQDIGNKVQGVDDRVQGISSHVQDISCEVRGVDDKLDQVNRSLSLQLLFIVPRAQTASQALSSEVAF